MLKKEAHKIVGGLSKPGKMPGPAYNLPAWNCITGSKLRKIKTSPCYGCYEVCRQTPNTKHWLPTQERQFLTMDPDEVPDNLIIRLSGSKVDGPASKCWPHSSSVVTDDATRTCPAPEQGNACRSCRACWNKEVKNIAYGKH
jgi:hypothetical protein